MRHLTAAALAASLLLAAPPASAAAPQIDLPYDAFTLDNGLRVVVHEDRKAPVVAISVWYHVGSKDEPEGKTGFAHLFEHIMFNGSEHYDGEWFEPLEEVGATDLNGTTWFDRTNYFQTVPTPALERVLWMESDRMGHLLGALTQEKLDEQRGVVQNEKRQGDNRPYGRMEYSVLEGLLPAGHPYRHSTIGSMEDLDAATLDDAKQWFKDYYGAANAVLVLAGDIDAATARPLVEKYFAHIPAGPPVTRPKANAPKLAVDKREIMYDRVPQPRIDRNWVAPGRTTREAVLLELAARVLGGGKTSRLYQRLVYDLELATRATADNQAQELMSFYSVTVDPKADADLDRVEREMETVIADFLAKGPTRAELDRARTAVVAEVLRGLEKVGGFGGKAVTLAEGALYADDPGFIKKQLEWLDSATPQEVLAAARDVMNAGYYQLTVLPFPEYGTAPPAVDRASGLPPAPDTPDLTFPAIEEARLSNGVQVVVATRRAMPLVEIAVQFDAGYAADSVPGGKLGAASFAGAMLDEGAGRRSALDIAQELEALGATLSAGSTLDTTGVEMSALKANLQPSLGILADVVRRPTFAEAEIEKLRARWIAGIEQEKANPVQLALRLLPPQIYGDGHAYAVPFTGSGTIESISSLTRDDLVGFHEKWLRPDNATIFVAGDVSMAEIRPLLERAFGDWRAPQTPKPEKNVATVARPAQGKVIIVDKPGSPQSLILAGHVAPPTGAPDNIAITAMNDIIGGQFTARVNMNLREDKGWAYGAYTFMQNAAGQRPWLVYAPVQTDKTKESIAELLRELGEFKTSRPATEQELERVVLNNVRSLPGQYETSGAVLDSLTSSARFGRPWNYPETLKEQYEALSLDDVKAAAARVVHPESLVWVIVGDREKIEDGVRALDLGPVEVMQASDL
ncbi:M16 family metallopeptidase [Amphiplicatus metriothermophilus]|uniref:Zinc protease n=2 Tax=Amphiplicatus metriothermophilus TaxID=1519374 RepID=A0A239PJP0_9PROT|nr:pitrilysin family protein [Amphiplicatus metriothermophilus]SNT67857.1 zinc protease [Amphiplicatus metriothermophilus]